MTSPGSKAMRIVFIALLTPILASCGTGPPAVPLRTPASAGAAAAPKSWEHAHRWLREHADRMAQDLEAAREALIVRAADDPEILARLTAEPARARPKGYGIVPEIVEDDAPAPVEPREKLYSLESLSNGFPPDFRDATMLAGRIAAEPDIALEPLVDEFERLRDRMRTLENHLGYHAYWQTAVARKTAYFSERNRIIGWMRKLQGLREAGGAPQRIAQLEAKVRDKIAPFRRTPGLAIEQLADGTRLLPVTVCTDIEDEGFLAAFEEGVRANFVDSESAQQMRFAVRLQFQRIPPAELYPEGPPARGSRLDRIAHQARFRHCPLVLTTGEESTHAWTGQSILLGPSPVSRRTLAHEFGHLLGFSDAYLRGFDGDPAGRFGAVLVEWTGLFDDLMGNSSGGRVTREMVRTLIEAYGAGPAAGDFGE